MHTIKWFLQFEVVGRGRGFLRGQIILTTLLQAANLPINLTSMVKSYKKNYNIYSRIFFREMKILPEGGEGGMGSFSIRYTHPGRCEFGTEI